MTTAEDVALVVALACETEDRTTADQRALLRVASRVEREINAQTIDNPALRNEPYGPCTFEDGPPAVHSSRCKCAPARRDSTRLAVRVPRGGWCRLVALVEATWAGDDADAARAREAARGGGSRPAR